MVHNEQKGNSTVNWIIRVQMIAIFLIMAYYVITEHQEHLFQYAHYILFLVFFLLLGLILWHFQKDSARPNAIEPEKSP